ncbi:MAG: TraR/DksA family transcriptional regulator [Planctomycetota bacterium]|jgi:DnaK suppressor protein|nr:TraR/DksA family transcriptional regulator [Blastopirellula sp.]
MGRKDTLNEMKAVLLQRREALRQALAGDDSLLRQMNQDSVGDVIDFASDSAFGELSSQLAEVASRELLNVEVALQLLAQGRYGVCEGCNQSIPVARLQALPYATTCINCQRQNESSGNSRSHDWGRLIDRSDDYRLTDLDFNIS